MTGFRSWYFPEPLWNEPVPRKPRRPRLIVNGWVVPSNAARAVGRFRRGGPVGYKADVPDSVVRATRAEAVDDWIQARPS